MKSNMINIAEILKDCPSGMELDCTLLEDLEFDGIVDSKYLPIRCRVKNPNGGYYVYNFTKYGCWFNTTFAKCAIFPKGKTTWEGFVPPCKFKVGDKVVFNDAKEKPLTIRKIWWDWQAKEILCSFEEDDIDVPVKDLDRYIKPKFDITTLKPFDKVLVRVCDANKWDGDFYMWYNNTQKEFPYYCVNSVWSHCIPFEGNEHLLGTTDDCDEFYKTWE